MNLSACIVGLSEEDDDDACYTSHQSLSSVFTISDKSLNLDQEQDLVGENFNLSCWLFNKFNIFQ